ncbi:hypothetical protein D3C76_1660570 [compost metagenome]
MEAQPAPVQISDKIYIHLKYSGLDMNMIGSPVIEVNNWLIGPVGDKKINSIPTTTTTEMKLGAYRNN